MRLILLAAAVTVGFTHEYKAVVSTRQPRIHRVCDKMICIPGMFCRVTRRGCGRDIKYTAKCVPCVRDGLDSLCNKNGYLRAILLNEQMEPQSCNHLSISNTPKRKCPPGSTCIPNPDIHGHGICCYGKPRHKEPIILPFNNGDRRCTECGGLCRKGYICQPSVNSCGRLIYLCRQKSD